MADNSQHALNAQQIDARLEGGDKITEPREVEHFAYFKRFSHAKAAASDLTAAGYTVGLNRRFTQTALQAVHVTPVDLETANAFTTQLETVVESHHGTYDGWGGTIVS